VTFTDNGDGTATLAGTPASGTTGSYPLTITASNSAGSRQQSFTLTVGQQAQTITFGPLPRRTYGAAPFHLSASSTSRLPVSFASHTPRVCGVSGTTVTLRSAGACKITATQPGNDTWAAATPITRKFILGYDVTDLRPPTRSLFTPGSTIHAQFQLTDNNTDPIPNDVATNLDCTVRVQFDNTASVCASYNAKQQLFGADLPTTRRLAKGTTHTVRVTVKVNRLTVATGRTVVLAR
jgi:hypothetical protein